MFSRRRAFYSNSRRVTAREKRETIGDRLGDRLAQSLRFLNCGVARASHAESLTRERVLQILELQILSEPRADKPNDAVYL